MLLLSVARDQIILAEAVELARVPILVRMFHLARLTAVVRIATVAHGVVGSDAATSSGIAIVLVDFCIGGTFAVAHVLRLVHAHVVILARQDGKGGER